MGTRRLSILAVRGTLVVSALVAGLGATSVQAQTQRSGGGNASAQLMQQMQQLASERTQLQGENADLKKQVEDLKKQLGDAKQQASAARAGAGRGQAAAMAAAREANERTQKSLDDNKAKMQELIGRFRETATSLRTAETERAQLQQQLTAGQASYDHCVENNYALYRLGDEVLDRYAQEGAFSRAARAEPFTRLKRTQIDNLVLEYRQRAQELQLKKATAAGPRGQPGAAPGKPASANPAAQPSAPSAEAPAPAPASPRGAGPESPGSAGPASPGGPAPAPPGGAATAPSASGGAT